MVDLRMLEELFIKVVEAGDADNELFISRSREGVFSPALTMWLSISGRLSGGRSLNKALSNLWSGECEDVLKRDIRSKRWTMKNVSMNSGGLSRAQGRLKLDVVRGFLERLSDEMMGAGTADNRWRGKRVFLFDGSTVALAHSSANLQAYRPIANEHRISHTPSLRCLFCHELYSGVSMMPSYGPMRGSGAVSEQSLYYQMIGQLPKGSLLIGDRNFGIFPVVYVAKERGQEVLVRLTVSRAKSIVGRAIQKVEYCDQLSEWRFRSTRAEHLNIPANASVSGRVIKFTIKRNGYRPLELYFFTTSSEPTEALVELYQQRERIENDIRTLKYTLSLEQLSARTPEMIEKEFLLGVAAYNLSRVVIAHAAAQLNLIPRQVSFSRATDLIRIFGNRIRDAKDKNEQKAWQDRFLRAISQIKLPSRKQQRVEPRKVVRKREKFPLMKKSRNEERENAKKVLNTHGHRGFFTTVSRVY